MQFQSQFGNQDEYSRKMAAEKARQYYAEGGTAGVVSSDLMSKPYQGVSTELMAKVFNESGKKKEAPSMSAEGLNSIGAGVKAGMDKLASGGSAMSATSTGLTAGGAALIAANPVAGGALLGAGVLTGIMGAKAERKRQEAEMKAQLENERRSNVVNQLNNMVRSYQNGVI